MSHQSQTPETAWRYFAERGVYDHPTIGQTFTPSRGWQQYAGRKFVSYSEVARLRRQGVTSVALDAGGRRADFTARELSAKVGFTRRQIAAFVGGLPGVDPSLAGGLVAEVAKRGR